MEQPSGPKAVAIINLGWNRRTAQARMSWGDRPSSSRLTAASSSSVGRGVSINSDGSGSAESNVIGILRYPDKGKRHFRGRPVRPDTFGRRPAALRGAADGGAPVVAPARRVAGGVEHLPGVLPGGVAARLPVRPPDDAVPGGPVAGGRPPVPPGAGRHHAPDRGDAGRSADRGPGRLAVRRAGGVGGAAVLRRLDDEPADA